MNIPMWSRPIPVMLLLMGCGDSSPGPTGPSGPSSFLTGTWRGTITIELNPGDPDAPPPASGPTQWTFEVTPQTDLRSFRATVRSEHPWLSLTTIATTTLTPGSTPPAQISTQGQFDSPRGCSGTFGSVGVAEATRIEADFTGTDCQQTTFIGRVVLTKD